jgi:hypothetical protein
MVKQAVRHWRKRKQDIGQSVCVKFLILDPCSEELGKYNN